jgi:hypothetical protein
MTLALGSVLSHAGSSGGVEVPSPHAAHISTVHIHFTTRLYNYGLMIATTEMFEGAC